MNMDGYIYKGTRGCSSCGGRGRVITSAVTTYEFTETCGYCRGHGYVSLYEIDLKASASATGVPAIKASGSDENGSSQ